LNELTNPTKFIKLTKSTKLTKLTKLTKKRLIDPKDQMY
jgi:hypothetical protein